jgi:hypothetical protein
MVSRYRQSLKAKRRNIPREMVRTTLREVFLVVKQFLCSKSKHSMSICRERVEPRILLILGVVLSHLAGGILRATVSRDHEHGHILRSYAFAENRTEEQRLLFWLEWDRGNHGGTRPGCQVQDLCALRAFTQVVQGDLPFLLIVTPQRSGDALCTNSNCRASQQ